MSRKLPHSSHQGSGGPRNLVPVLGDLYYRNGELHVGFPPGFFRAKKTSGLTGVSYAPLIQRSNLGGETMKMSAFLLASVCGVAPMLCAQQVATTAVSLKATTKVEAPLSHPMDVKGPAMCDGRGNVYALQLVATHWSPIQEITPDAKLAGNFGLPGSFPGDVRNVLVGQDGRVYQLAKSRQDSYVVEFTPDGSVKAKTKLEVDPYVEGWHLAVFKSGEYLLVGGTVVATRTGIKEERTPFTAVFAADGRLVKKIYEPEAEEARQKGESDVKIGVTIDNSNFLTAGDVAAGSDGNVYLLRGGYPSLVYVISPSGEVLRKLRVDTGNPDLVAENVKFYAGRLAIQFYGLGAAHQNLIKVMDLKGNAIADYEVGADEYPILACYDSEGFTMIPAHSETKLQLLKVKLP
jgi:hypothetical protein